MEGKKRPEKLKSILEFNLDVRLEIDRKKVIESIKNNGVEGSMTIISEWCSKAEKWTEEDKTKKRMVIINFAKYDFYLAAKDIEGAQECARDSVYMAEQEGYEDLKKFINSKAKY